MYIHGPPSITWLVTDTTVSDHYWSIVITIDHIGSWIHTFPKCQHTLHHISMKSLYCAWRRSHSISWSNHFFAGEPCTQEAQTRASVCSCVCISICGSVCVCPWVSIFTKQVTTRHEDNRQKKTILPKWYFKVILYTVTQVDKLMVYFSESQE